MKLNSSFCFFVTQCFAIAIVAGSIGCDQPDTQTGSSSGVGTITQSGTPASANPIDNVSGETILQQSLARYQSATRYSDKAVLYLNYRLQGRRIQEPHPYSTTWDRTGRLASKIFNAQVVCDGHLLSCYVFDIDSANLENQQLYLPAQNRIPIKELYQDSIVRHFLGGYSELPLDESEKTLLPKLIPPPISLLSGQTTFGWLQSPDQVQRQPDASVDDRSCYVIRSQFQGSTADIWVDQQSGLLVQVSLPLKLMAREVLTTGEIKDVELLIHFHEASLDRSIEDDTFAIKARPESTPVRRFVSVPEPFPSELIGQIAPNFQLFKPDREPVNRLTFDGKTTVLLWLGGDSSIDSVEKLSLLNREFDSSNHRFGAVYSDLELQTPGSSSIEPNEKLKSAANSNSLPIYYDRQLDASSALKVRAIPTVLVLDGDSKVQFARALSDEKWVEDLTGALKRIANGEDVADEMKQEYQNYLDDYHQQLIAVSAGGLIGSRSVGLANKGYSDHADKLASHRKNTPESNSNGPIGNARIEPTRSWSNTNFKKPGNIAVLGDSIFAFDGWQTIVELNASGQQLARHELKLPDREAVNCIRISRNSNDNLSARFALFSVQGQQVYLFDKQWKPVAILPAHDFEHGGIRDVQFVDLNEDGQQELVVAFADSKGVFAFDMKKRTTRSISKSDAEFLVAMNNSVLFCNEQQIGLIDDTNPTIAADGTQFHRLIGYQADSAAAMAAVVVDADRNWFLAGIYPSKEIGWKQPIGSQMFETQIEPLAAIASGSASGDNIVFAIADTDHRVTLVSQNGSYLGQYKSASPIAGVSLMNGNGRLKLLVSESTAVKCFELQTIR